MATEPTDSGLWFDVAKAVNAASAQQSTRQPSNTLDKNAFLRLLTTQLQYQDPLNPVEDKEFIAQMAQFTSLEQMQNMSRSMMQQQGYAMLGKIITSTIYNENTKTYEDVDGVVAGVTMKNGEPYLYVNEKDVPIDKVLSVSDLASQASQLAGISSLLANTQTLGLVGKYVQGFVIDEKGEAKEFIEGKVDNIKFNGSQPILVIGTKELFATEVVSVADKNLLLGRAISAEIKNSAGEVSVVSGTVSGVTIKDNKAYLEIGDKSVLVTKINYATDALALVGQTIKTESVSGTVSGVKVKDGIPYLLIGEKELSFTKYKDIKSGTV